MIISMFMFLDGFKADCDAEVACCLDTSAITLLVGHNSTRFQQQSLLNFCVSRESFQYMCDRTRDVLQENYACYRLCVPTSGGNAADQDTITPPPAPGA